MMLKVFLVEDEMIIRKGIKESIPWEREGFEFAGEAGDGELAYPMIRRIEPDILITDIRMPFMDGLELSRLVRKEFPKMKIIFLSGYDDFDYAKQAIQIGATDYLLKPISSAQLLEVIHQVAKKIRHEREQEILLNQYRNEMKENLDIERQKILSSILSGKMTMGEILEEGEKLEMDFTASYLNVLIFKGFSTAEHVREDSQSLAIAADEIKMVMEEEPGILVFDRDENSWVFIIKGESQKEIEDRLSIAKLRLKMIMEKYPKLSYYGGVGITINRLTDLSKSYSKANRAFASRFFCEQDRIVDVKEANRLVMSFNKDMIDIKDIDFSIMSKKKAQAFIRDGTHTEVQHFLEEYFDSIGESAKNSLMLRQYMVMDMYFSAISYLKELGKEVEELPKKCQRVGDIASYVISIEKSIEYLTELFIAVIDIRDGCAHKKYADMMNKARHYIDANFNDPNLSLKMVSEYVNISSCYFSSIFSQEMGQTFIEYLTQNRMRAAKELLRNTNKRSSEIAREVGYQDSHYFSFLFKKTQGMTSSEYRKRGQEES